MPWLALLDLKTRAITLLPTDNAPLGVVGYSR
jgi:hypothetical protein